MVECRTVTKTSWWKWCSAKSTASASLRADSCAPPGCASPRREAEQRQQKDFGKQCAANGWLGVLRWAWENGCPMDHQTCAQAAEGGHLDVLPWARASGCIGRVRGQPVEAISRCSSGRRPTAAHGTVQPVRRQRSGAISMCCSGRGPTAVHGTRRPVQRRPTCDGSRRVSVTVTRSSRAHDRFSLLY
jgi:hypothetical protein